MDMEVEVAREILRVRLHMMPLPCNYGQSVGCSVCLQTGKIETEHYLTCKGIEYMRRKWGITEETRLETEDWNEARMLSRFLGQVCIIFGTVKMDGE